MALTPEAVEARYTRKREAANQYRLTHPGQAKITRKARREWQRATVSQAQDKCLPAR